MFDDLLALVMYETKSVPALARLEGKDQNHLMTRSAYRPRSQSPAAMISGATPVQVSEEDNRQRKKTF